MSIVTIDVTDIEEAGWAWDVGHGATGRFVAYVHFVDYALGRDAWGAEGERPCTHGWGTTPQEALDDAYRAALAIHCAFCRAPLGDNDLCSAGCEAAREAAGVVA